MAEKIAICGEGMTNERQSNKAAIGEQRRSLIIQEREEIVRLRENGVPIRTIAERLGIKRKRVRKVLLRNMEAPTS